jgi:hypothetical protein
MPKSDQEDVTQSWAEAQRRLWDGWLAAMRQGGASPPNATGANPAELWAHVIDTWEPFVRQTLDAQSTAMQDWAAGISAAPDVPDHLRPQLQQVQELTRGWTDTQRQLWEAMFAVARQLASSSAGQHAVASQWPTPELWREFARPVLEAQADWLRQWSGLLAAGRSGPPHQG